MDAPLPFASPTSTADGAEHDLCWVCLSSCEESEALRQPCKCPRVCHMKCLARWQLQSAGKAEEWECRFCGSTLPDWRPHLTPDGLTPQEPVMSIHFGGETYLVKVGPGEEGQRVFQQEVRRLLRLDDDQEFDISFECKVPGASASSSKMELKGMSAYDAAVYCASITASERKAHAARIAHEKAAQEASHRMTSAPTSNTCIPDHPESAEHYVPPSSLYSLRNQRGARNGSSISSSNISQNSSTQMATPTTPGVPRQLRMPHLQGGSDDHDGKASPRASPRTRDSLTHSIKGGSMDVGNGSMQRISGGDCMPIPAGATAAAAGTAAGAGAARHPHATASHTSSSPLSWFKDIFCPASHMHKRKAGLHYTPPAPLRDALPHPKPLPICNVPATSSSRPAPFREQ